MKYFVYVVVLFLLIEIPRCIITCSPFILWRRHKKVLHNRKVQYSKLLQSRNITPAKKIFWRLSFDWSEESIVTKNYRMFYRIFLICIWVLLVIGTYLYTLAVFGQ